MMSLPEVRHFLLSMDLKEVIKLVYQKKWLVFWLTVLGAVLAFDLAVVQSPQHRASSKVLIIQKQVAGQDIYSISKSAQYLGKILREGIYSDSFFEKVIESPYQVEESDFPELTKDRRKQWQKDVKVSIVRDLGIIKIDVFNLEKEKAEQISLAVTNVLEVNHQLYHGAGESLELRVLDNPLVSQKPDASRLWFSSVIGGVIGFLIGLFWIFNKKKKEEGYTFPNEGIPSL